MLKINRLQYLNPKCTFYSDFMLSSPRGGGDIHMDRDLTYRIFGGATCKQKKYTSLNVQVVCLIFFA